MQNVSFGKNKINARANTIELDNIGVKHREFADIGKYKSDWLFKSNDKFQIGPGITLLSGASGAGKSSLLNLLMHSDDVVEGAIRIGEVNDKGKFVGDDYKKLALVENFLQRDVFDHFGRDEMLSDLNGLSDYQKIGIIGGVALLIVALLWNLIMLFFVAIAFVVVGIYAGYSYDRLNRLHKKTNF